NGVEAEKLAKKEISLFIVNRDIALKYKIKLDCDYDKAEYMPKETYTANQSLSLTIDEIKLTPLETKERNMLDNIVYAKKMREKDLAKQQNEQAS
uniref:hypothetical protein n=1 Tax=Sulfurimonas sp. TaxID=2022749 RepID=UPI003D1496AE